MSEELKLKNGKLRVVKGDITDLEIESFVYYAQHDLALGSGYGNAISMRGGPGIQEELKELGPLETTQVVTSGAGELKASKIIHAVGPRFQEEDIEAKLKATVENCLKEAEKQGVKAVAFPAMGCGFYGIPLETSASITLETIKAHLSNGGKLEDVVVVLNDTRDYKPFAAKLATLKSA